MYNLNELRRGNFINLENVPYMVIENEFVKPGKGTPFNRVRMKNLLSGKTEEKTFKIGEKMEKADIETQEWQYLYNDGEAWHFMNLENAEQIELHQSEVEEIQNYLLEQTICTIMFYNGRPLTVDLPNFIILEIVYTEPGLKGDTSNMPFKTAKLETGAEMQVPLFCEIGDKIRIDSREMKYMERMR